MPPAAPASVRVTADQPNATITVNWFVPSLASPATAITELRVQRRDPSDTANVVTVHTDTSPTANTAGSFTDHMAPLETSLEYRCVSVDANNATAASSWIE